MTFAVSEDAVEGDTLHLHFTRAVVSDVHAGPIPTTISDGFVIIGAGGWLDGDANLDGEIDIVDVVFMANIIIEQVEPSFEQLQAADCNRDGTVNVLDLVGVVNLILGTGTCAPD